MLSISQRDCSKLNELVRVYHLDMPHKIRGHAIAFPDGYYAIILNSRLSWEQNVKTLKHEYKHILEGDFDGQCSVNDIETIRHTSEP